MNAARKVISTLLFALVTLIHDFDMSAAAGILLPMKDRTGGSIPQTVLITGASSGFGSCLARAFARAGCDVVLHGTNEMRLTELKEKIEAEARAKVFTIVADLKVPESLEKLAESMRSHGVSVLVNNAAINPELQHGRTVAGASEIHDIVSTNMTALIALSMSAYEYFAASGGGLIINMNSVAGLKGSAHESLYAASKFGVRGFSESVKEEWRKKGVRLTDVYSGGIATGMSSGRGDKDSLIDPDELAELIVHASATGSFFVRELHVQKART